MATHAPFPLRPRVHARLGGLTRALMALLALTLSVLLALTLPRAMPSRGHAASALLEAADVHLYAGGAQGELEINVDITQTRDDCGAPLNGQLCLRYSITQDDQPLAAGVGLIPASDVHTSGATLTLSTNTAADPNVHRAAGGGGVIALTWTPSASGRPVTAHGHTTTLSPATVAGTVLGRPLVGQQLHASVVTAE